MLGLYAVVIVACFATSYGAFAQAVDLSVKATEKAVKRADEINNAANTKQTGPEVITSPLNRRELPPRGGPTVLLQSVSFSPESAFLSVEELDAIVSKYKGKRIDFSQISELVRDVNDLYAAKGVVTAAAILPPQNLSLGQLSVTLVEGQVGTVAVVGDHRTKSSFVLNRVRFAKGTTVDVPTATKDIVWFNKNNQAQVRMLLEPGARFGLTNLRFGITEPKKNQLQFFVDNEGTYSTGEMQASGVYRRYGLLGLDDTLLLYLTTSEGSTAGTVRYDIPVTKYGTRLTFSQTGSMIDVANGPSAVLNISGSSTSTSVSLSQPLVANNKWSLMLDVVGFRGLSRSSSGVTTLVDSDTSKIASGVTFGFTGKRLSFSTHFQKIFATVKDRILATKTDVNIMYSTMQGSYKLDNGYMLTGNAVWQATSSKLLPGNLLFQIGGPTTVRGYPSDGVAGDQGYYANFEMKHSIQMKNMSFDGYVFADIGEVRSTFPARTRMASVGFGLSKEVLKGTRLEASIAFPVINAVTNQSNAELSISLSKTLF
ncbi:MAG: ShlB/FhaC/HecB family hemolysin secretion/activation protein [Rhodobacterales bacterium]